MRTLKVVLIFLLLTGCVNKQVSLDSVVETSLSKINDITLPISNNHSKKLLSYYLPQDIGILESNNISSILTYNHNQIFMSINVSNVLSETEDVRTFSSADFEVSKSIEVSRRNDETVDGQVYIEKLSNHKYLVYVLVDDVFLLSSVEYSEITDVLERMIMISRTVNIDKKAVVAQFSNKESMSYQKIEIELFSESIPSEGMIKDIITNDEEGD